LLLALTACEPLRVRGRASERGVDQFKVGVSF
jgi:hypothetical protein